MALWVIGDVHGCWFTLQRMLDRINWDPARDELCFVGDLVNKGRHSLEVLRWVSGAGPRVGCVLGNLDLHLLARAQGLAPSRPEDTIQAVLEAPDREAMLDWLIEQPFVRRCAQTIVVHAGVIPTWPLSELQSLASRCSEEIAARGLRNLWENRSIRWRPGLGVREETAAAAGVLTRVRMIDREGVPLLSYSGGLVDAPKGSRPWFAGSALLDQGLHIVFGHWACLGTMRTDRLVCLDSGCVYGGALSAYDVGHDILVHESCDPEDRLG